MQEYRVTFRLQPGFAKSDETLLADNYEDTIERALKCYDKRAIGIWNGNRCILTLGTD